MIQLEAKQTVPLMMDGDGAIRVKGSRVTLDVIVSRFNRGDSAEDIQESLPTILLGQIYGALTYYLEHKRDVEAYLRYRCQEAEQLHKFWEKHPKSVALRRRLRGLRPERKGP